MDATTIIKDRLTMADVLSRYGFEPKKRMKCPLHNGDDLNFEVKEKTYTCYSRCGGGDVISFVQNYFNIGFAETLKKIDTDFALGLFGKQSYREVQKSQKEAFLRKKQAEEKTKQKEKAVAQYWAVFDEWKRLVENKKKYAPKTPEEEPHPLFVEALKKLTHQEFLLECAEIERRKNDD